jgi:hypothetical protein
MNSILNYAVTASIRERQIAEKKERDAAEKAADRMRDLQAEIEALELRKAAEEAEAARRTVIDKVKAEMFEQVKEALNRKKEMRDKLKAEELSRKAALQKQLEQEAREKEVLAKKKAEIFASTLKHNEAALAAKKARKEAELEADRRADAEAAERERQKQLQEEAKELARKAREEAEFKVRGAVQKFLDNSDARQEMLMRRAYEEGERREREKELVRARKQAQAQEELARARVQMLEEKQARVAEMIDGEREEFETAKRIQDAWLEQEKAKEEAQAASNAVFLKAVRSQVDEKERRAREERIREREELERARAAHAAEMEHLRALRDAKIEEMKRMGLPGKYQTELARYDPERAAFKKELADRKVEKRGEGASPAKK